MKMYADLTVEGTPEEVAAFKHIDAALTARGKQSMKAIEGPKKPAPKKVPSKRVGKPKTTSKTPPFSELAATIIDLAATKDGVSSRQVAEYLEVDMKTVYNRLHVMKAKGLLIRGGDGLYRPAKKHADV